MGRREKMPVIPREGEVPLGAKIRARRWQQGMSLAQLAAVAGNYDQSHLSHIENGRDIPSPELLETIAQALNTTVAELRAATPAQVQGWLDAHLQQAGAGRQAAGAALNGTAKAAAASTRPLPVLHILRVRTSLTQPQPRYPAGYDQAGLRGQVFAGPESEPPRFGQPELPGPAPFTEFPPPVAAVVPDRADTTPTLAADTAPADEGKMTNETFAAGTAEATAITPEVLAQVAAMLNATPAELEGASEEQLVAWLDDPASFAAARAAGTLPAAAAAVPYEASDDAAADGDSTADGVLTPDVLEKVAGMLGATVAELEGATEEQLVAWLDDPAAFAAARAAGELPSQGSGADEAATPITPEVLAQVAGMLGATVEELEGASEEQLVAWLDDPSSFAAARAAGTLPAAQLGTVAAAAAIAETAAGEPSGAPDEAPVAALAPLPAETLATIAPVIGATVEELLDVPADKVLAWLDNPELFEQERRGVVVTAGAVEEQPAAAAAAEIAPATAAADAAPAQTAALAPEMLATIALTLGTTVEELEGASSEELMAWLADPELYHARRSGLTVDAPATMTEEDGSAPSLVEAVSEAADEASAGEDEDEDAIPLELLTAVAQAIGTTPAALRGADELQLMAWFQDPDSFPGPRSVPQPEPAPLAAPAAALDSVAAAQADGPAQGAQVKPILPDNPSAFKDEYQLAPASTAARFRQLREMTARDKLGDRPEVLNPLLQRMREIEQYQDEVKAQSLPASYGSAPGGQRKPPSSSQSTPPRTAALSGGNRGGGNPGTPPPPKKKDEKSLLGGLGGLFGGLFGSSKGKDKRKK